MQHYNSTTRSGSISSDSTTLSEFVRRRYTGETAVFGGNPATGVREFGTAMYGSGSTEVVQAMSKLTTALNSFGRTSVRDDPGQSVSPIVMVDADPSVSAMTEAVKLDDDKLRLLLAASFIDPKDTQRYVTLFGLARESMAKKLSAMKATALRKEAKVQPGPLMSVPEIIALIGNYDGRVAATREIFGLGGTNVGFDQDLAVALTHDSFTDGRETNRVFAFLGDAAMRCAAAKWAFDNRRSVSDLSDLVQMTQNNLKLRDSAVAKNFHVQILVKHGVDSASKAVVATAFEAVLGVVAMHYGIDAVAGCMSEFSMFEVEASTPRVA